MKSSFLLLLLTFLYGSSRAQTLTGTIYGEQHTPIPFATLTLQSPDASPQRVTMTDSAGHFRFSGLRTGSWQLSATMMGYKPLVLELPIRKDTGIVLLLKTDPVQLGEVAVSAAKPAISDQADKLVYNISSNVTATGADILATIGKIPGVRVNDNEISLAGKGAVKVMVNGRLLQLSGLDLMRYLKSLSANQVTKIELLKNPGANYEADGNAGLINISTKQSKQQGYSGNIQANAKRWFHSPAEAFGTSNYEALNASAVLNYNSARWSAYGSINADQDHHLEGFETTIDYPKQRWQQADTGNYTYNNVNVVAGVDYKLGYQSSIGINYQGGKNIYDGSDHVYNPVHNKVTGKLDSLMQTYATYHPVALSNAINLHSVIHFDSTGRKLLLNADYFNYYRTDRSNFETNNYRGDDLEHSVGTTRYYDDNKQNINIYTFKADVEIPTTFARIGFGTKLSFIDNYSNAFYYKKNKADEKIYDPNLSNEFDYRENTQAAYINASKEIDKWKFEAGLRGELTQTKGYSYTVQQTTLHHYFRLFPSVLASYQANADNSFSFTFGKRVNRPSFWNLNPFKSLYTAYSYGEGNPYLSPEYSSNFELSYSYKSRFTTSVFFNITNNGFNNVTMASADTNLVYTIPLNFIRTDRVGITESIALSPLSWWDNNNQVTLYHTDAHSLLPAISSISAFSAYLSTSNNIYLNKDKTFAAAVNFWYQFPEIDHIGKTNTYYKLDLGVRASLLKKQLDLALTMNDLFRSSAVAMRSTINGIPQQFTNFQLNRFLLLSVSYKFGRSEHKVTTGSTGNEDERSRIH
ncbi:outer membrane receptor protein involved in Fe transport [Chitinophaga polysaccharea]|uniref:Outer membrane receptor protein involved in Fe transport n=1 Tax=Chitinophaga polysaccharea TaxID=1293035 RepID=A0A561PQX0_9BACT|nr:outer membrane beta-barrel protein [Chitinophaga polysaccharea]TWF40499.1 outer membrane receptor protein involved in Fe transport [Chitinophaga polysaccharea]